MKFMYKIKLDEDERELLIFCLSSSLANSMLRGIRDDYVSGGTEKNNRFKMCILGNMHNTLLFNGYDGLAYSNVLFFLDGSDLAIIIHSLNEVVKFNDRKIMGIPSDKLNRLVLLQTRFKKLLDDKYTKGKIGLYKTFQKVLKERRKQEKKWGQQNHSLMHWLPILGEEYGEVSKVVVDDHF